MSRVAAFAVACAIAFFAASFMQPAPAFAGSGKSAHGHAYSSSGRVKSGRVGKVKRQELAGMPLPGKRIHRDGYKGHDGWRHSGGRHGRPDWNNHAASSGVYLSSGRNTTWRGRHGHEFGRSKWKGHDGRHDRRYLAGGPQVIDIRDVTRIDNRAIAVVSGVVAAQEQAEAAGARIEEACEAGTYCVVRLGPYTNSPKIITLNKTGAAIDPSAAEK